MISQKFPLFDSSEQESSQGRGNVTSQANILEERKDCAERVNTNKSHFDDKTCYPDKLKEMDSQLNGTTLSEGLSRNHQIRDNPMVDV